MQPVYTGNLAALALDREQWAEAAIPRREASRGRKVGRLELIASNCYHLAQALLKQNHNLEEGYRCHTAVLKFTRACDIRFAQIRGGNAGGD